VIVQAISSFLRRLFGRRLPLWLDEPRTDYRSLDIPSRGADESVANEYARVVSNVLRSWGVTEGCAEVDVHLMGERKDGRKVYVAAVRIVSWERRPGLRLLLGLPLLERKIRRTLQAHWVAEVSHFAGTWLHATDRLNDLGAQSDLRPLLITLTQESEPGATDDPGSHRFGARR
jgi:hypothetical protein